MSREAILAEILRPNQSIGEQYAVWTVQTKDGKVYCVSILDNYSRAILASAVSRRQDLTAYLMVLYAAIRQHGAPEALVERDARRSLRFVTNIGESGMILDILTILLFVFGHRYLFLVYLERRRDVLYRLRRTRKSKTSED